MDFLCFSVIGRSGARCPSFVARAQPNNADDDDDVFPSKHCTQTMGNNNNMH